MWESYKMNTTFTKLKNNHRFIIGTAHHTDNLFNIADLIENKSSVRELLHIQKQQIKADKLALTGLLFGKMFSVFAMGFYESIVKHGIIIDTAPENISIELKERNVMNYWIDEDAVYHVKDLSAEKVQQLIYTFIVSNLQPLFQSAAKVSQCKATHMRSIVSHNLHQSHKKLMESEGDPDQVEKIFQWLTSDELFGQHQRNPLHFDFRFYKSNNGETTYVRRHCCMKYMLHGADHSKRCATCPLISDQEREKKI